MFSNYINNLGFQARDKVSGFTGVITDVSFGINGQINYFISPAVDHQGSLRKGEWFDNSKVDVDNDMLRNVEMVGF